MDQKDQIGNGIEQLFRDKLNIEVPTHDTDLIAEGILDSLLLVDLLLHLERDYQISIALDDLELDNFRTIHAIKGFIECCAVSSSRTKPGV